MQKLLVKSNKMLDKKIYQESKVRAQKESESLGWESLGQMAVVDRILKVWVWKIKSV